MSLPSLARSLGRDPALAFGLAVLNPATLLHGVGGAHNDVLMAGLLVAGLALAKRNRPVLGIVLCALAASVKVPAALGIIYIGWDWVGTARVCPRARETGCHRGADRRRPSWGPCRSSRDSDGGGSRTCRAPGSVRSWMAPATGSGIFLTDVMHVRRDLGGRAERAVA